LLLLSLIFQHARFRRLQERLARTDYQGLQATSVARPDTVLFCPATQAFTFPHYQETFFGLGASHGTRWYCHVAGETPEWKFIGGHTGEGE
jgi:hypothetical protein